MILIVCPNLSVDVTLEIDALTPGAVHRAERQSLQAGGKGVNVARALGNLGVASRVLGFAGGVNATYIAEGLAQDGVDAELIGIDGESRTCTILLEPDGRASVVNTTGPEITEASELVARYEQILPQARAVALMGSLPPGLDPGLYAQLVALARGASVFCLVDASGEALRHALEARPSLVKPNHLEAAELLRRPVESESACLEACAELCALGAEIALVTRGAQGVTVASGAERASARVDSTIHMELGNPTGAGDALAAGLLAGRERGFAFSETIRFAVATATASLAEGYGRFRARDVRVEAVQYEPR